MPASDKQTVNSGFVFLPIYSDVAPSDVEEGHLMLDHILEQFLDRLDRFFPVKFDIWDQY